MDFIASHKYITAAFYSSSFWLVVYNSVANVYNNIAGMRAPTTTQPRHRLGSVAHQQHIAPANARASRCISSRAKGRTQPIVPSAAAETTIQTATSTTTATTPANAFTKEDLDAFVTGYTSIFTEHTLPITSDLIDGQIPAQLSGTYVRNIPGLLEIGGVKIPQPFDGDGMVAAVTFDQGRALFRNKYVRTEALIKEQAAGRMLYQGVFNKVGSEDTLFNNPFTLVRERGWLFVCLCVCFSGGVFSCFWWGMCCVPSLSTLSPHIYCTQHRYTLFPTPPPCHTPPHTHNPPHIPPPLSSGSEKTSQHKCCSMEQPPVCSIRSRFATRTRHRHTRNHGTGEYHPCH